MKKWIVDKQEIYIIVHEKANPDNCIFCSKADFIYDEDGVIKGFKHKEENVSMAFTLCAMLNELELYREGEREGRLVWLST